MLQLRDGSAFVHCPKTGGTWVERVLEARGVVYARFGQHDPGWMHPHVGVPRFGTTRDPWSWYASLYRHALAVCEPAGAALREYAGPRWGCSGAPPFAAVLPGLLGHGSASSACVGVIWHPVQGGREAFAASGVGLWTWAHRYVYGSERLWRTGVGPWEVDAFLDQAVLAEALRAMTELSGADVPPANAWVGEPHERLYDTAMVEAVEAADGALARQLGMTPFGPAASPVVVVEALPG